MQRLLERLETADALDRPASKIAGAAEQFRGRPGRILRGQWLGHPLHPVAVTAPIGAWLTAAVFDCFPGQERAAERSLGLGLAAAPAAAVLGLADFRDLDARQRRVGLLHLAANAVATSLCTASYVARRRGRLGAGRLLALGGLAAAATGGALGGHLSYALGAGVYRWQNRGPAQRPQEVSTHASGV